MPAITSKIEIEFVPNSDIWVDISSRVTELRIVRPRAGLNEDATPTTLELSVLNHPDPVTGFCPLSPDSPVSPYYPNVTRDRQVRVTALWSGGSSQRFLGWTDVFIPDAGDRPPATATVQITASDVLGRYARRRVLSLYGESAINPNGAGTADYYPFNDDADSTLIRGWDAGNNTARDGQVVAPANRLPGSLTINPPDGGHLTDGQLDFSRGDDNAPAPVVLLRPRSPFANVLASISGWFKLTTDPAGVAGDDMITAYDSFGDLHWTWSVKIVVGKVTWTLNDRDGNAMSFYNTNAPRDDGWHFWLVRFYTDSTSAITIINKGMTTGLSFGSGTWSYNPTRARYLVLGGKMPPLALGKQSNTFQGSMSSLMLQYDTPVFNFVNNGNPGVVQSSNTATGYLNATSQVVDSTVAGALGGSSPTLDTTPILQTNTTSTLLDRWNEIARTTQGTLLTRTDGRREYRSPTTSRPVTVSVTLHAEQDLSAPDGGWQASKEERPTRVTVGSPLGSFLVVDTPTEDSTGLRLESSRIDTAAGSDAAARAVAGRVMSSGYLPRLSSFGCDLSTTSTNKIAALMALQPYERMRITTLPGALMGFTYLDVYASGWTEIYDADQQSCAFQFDTDPADDPPEGRFDDAEYGRFALGTNATTITGGTCVGTTGTGTVILTGKVLTTAGAAYPLDLDWNGERVTVSGVGGGTSPQTATVSVRGAAPAVARVHAAGEPVEIWHAMRFGA